MVRLLGIVHRDPSGLMVQSSCTAGPKDGKEMSVLSTVNIQEMPSLVFNHAGRKSRWLCHGLGTDSSITTSFESPTIHQNTPNDLDVPFHLTEYEIKYYLCHLLIALDALHSKGIIHRDVKPRNILINRTWPIHILPSGSATVNRKNPAYEATKTHGYQSLHSDTSLHPSPLVLIDFGLADFYLPNKAFNVRVASRHYKAPELLLGYEFYDYGIDMWGVGCILAGLLFRREPFFRGKDNTDQLGEGMFPMFYTHGFR